MTGSLTPKPAKRHLLYWDVRDSLDPNPNEQHLLFWDVIGGKTASLTLMSGTCSTGMLLAA